jgi:hypothetical protein
MGPYVGSAALYYLGDDGSIGSGVVPCDVQGRLESPSRVMLTLVRAGRPICSLVAVKGAAASWRELTIVPMQRCDGIVAGGTVVIERGSVDFTRDAHEPSSLCHGCPPPQRLLTAILRGRYGLPHGTGAIEIDFQGGRSALEP